MLVGHMVEDGVMYAGIMLDALGDDGIYCKLIFLFGDCVFRAIGEQQCGLAK